MNASPKPDDTDAYYLALGRFIDKFAEAEKALLECLRVWSHMTTDTARAIFSGVRTEAASSYINRIIDVMTEAASPDPKIKEKLQAIKQDFQGVLTQLGHINATRNLIVHYGTIFNTEGDHYTSNKDWALTKERIRETPVSAQIMKQMTSDLEKIITHCNVMSFRYILDFDNPFGILGPHLPDEAALKSPWQYKPAQQPSHREKSRAKTPKRQPPPESSRD
jgi:hypothetical protein